jgi:peptidyl-prolyl cis-trans isomerase C
MRRRSLSSIPGFLLSAVLPLAACHDSKTETGTVPAPSSGVVAQFGTHVVTADDVQEQLNRLEPSVRARFTTPERKKEFLDSLLRLELLAEEGLKKGYQNDPDLIRMYKQWLVSRLVQKSFDPQFDPKAVPDEEVRKYYEEHKDQAVRPQTRRAVEILVKTEAVAQKVNALARKLTKTDDVGFTALVEGFSERPGVNRHKGDLGILVPVGPNSHMPQPLVDAVFALPQVGDIAGPIASPDGFHIFRLTEIHPSIVLGFEELESTIRGSLNKERREKGMKEWVERLKAESKVEIFDKELDKVKVDTTAPPKRVNNQRNFQIEPELVPGHTP